VPRAALLFFSSGGKQWWAVATHQLFFLPLHANSLAVDLANGSRDRPLVLFDQVREGDLFMRQKHEVTMKTLICGSLYTYSFLEPFNQ
jgi:hypothetical protein